MAKLSLGLDDVDSREGSCTTYVSSLIVEGLLDLGVKFLDYPNLIRLNPNIPWKTRGNGAVALRIDADNPRRVFSFAKRIVKEKHERGSDAGLVMLEGDVPEDVKDFSVSALHEVLSLKRARSLIERYKMSCYSLGSELGLIGALAAIGNELDGDYTFELLAYRRREMWGKKRLIDPKSVIEMDMATRPFTFNNYDEETSRILITPRGPDPVLFGIRGEDPEILLDAMGMLKLMEPVDRYVMFRSNQGTNEHLKFRFDLGRLKAYTSGFVIGSVSERARMLIGGHVSFKLKNKGGEANCMVYEPTGRLRWVAMSLISGDEVEVGGGVRKKMRKNPTSINVEYVKVLKLKRLMRLENPLCPKCGGRMESMGRGQGYRCKKCGYKDANVKKVARDVERGIKEGLYLPPERAHRHLTKPLRRFELEKKGFKGRLIEGWFKF